MGSLEVLIVYRRRTAWYYHRPINRIASIYRSVGTIAQIGGQSSVELQL